ncbi:1120_t:CDS:2, partial [Acaulospora morrowiae]
MEKFKYPHYGDNIEDCLQQEFNKWNITNKLLSGTTDNDSAMVKAMRQLQVIHIRCIAHTMQLAIKDELKQSKELIEKAKNLNSFIANRDKYRDLLKQTYQEINFQSNELSVYNPITTDTDTRWNNSNRAIRNDGELLEQKLLTNSDWQALEELIIILRPFVDATNLMSGSTYSTLSL